MKALCKPYTILVSLLALSKVALAQSGGFELPPEFDMSGGDDEFITIQTLQIGKCYKLKPYASSDFFLMNALTDGELRAYVTDDTSDANIWRVQAGLIGDINTISFESIVAPGHFLIFNKDGQVRVDSGYSTPFKIKASFR